MFVKESNYILVPSGRTPPSERRHEIHLIGAKAAGLATLPPHWTPPFFVVSADLYRAWEAADEIGRRETLTQVCIAIQTRCETTLAGGWNNGVVLRSSAVNETMNERGAYESREIPADFGPDALRHSIEKIYESFAQSGGTGAIAIVVQARAHCVLVGHLSNERRVSKSVNHWMWEVEAPNEAESRFNSQRSKPANDHEHLVQETSTAAFEPVLKRVGRWCTGLKSGRTHLEWGASSNKIWLFQIDFEDDQPDSGQDPRALLRASDQSPAGPLPSGSPFHLVDGMESTGWSKIDKIKEFVVDRVAPYPSLHFITGSDFEAARASGLDLTKDIQAVAGDRAVCRTDCRAPGVSKVNLPRTDSVSAEQAITFMIETLSSLRAQGANSEDVCFIIHKFIPAVVAAWALARPTDQIVLVDSLWGLPDGLQYLTHDTFEYDLKRNECSSETIRFKPTFLQETSSGDWVLVRVSRNLTRHRSLAAFDLRDVATQTYNIASRLNKPVQMMWFCDVPEKAGVGRNVPWFMMPPEETSSQLIRRSIAPGLKKLTITTIEDLKDKTSSADGRFVLQLEPKADLFRDSVFIDAVARVAREKNLPVALTGSVLSHAFYSLERAGVSVVTLGGNRKRVRRKQIFRKLVRDEIPIHIAEHGERASLAHIDKSESRAALVVKLFEEAHELLVAVTLQEVIGELADLLEVIRSLSTSTGVDWESVTRAADEKRRSRGSFERNTVLLETSWPKWSEAAESGVPKTIPLKELGRVIHDDDGTHTLTFPALLARGADNVIELSDGSRIAVSITGSGVKIQDLGSSMSDAGRQLAFDFGDE